MTSFSTPSSRRRRRPVASCGRSSPSCARFSCASTARRRGSCSGEALDATPSNIVVDPESGEWSIIDREWRFDGVLPIDYVLWRGLHHASARYPELAGSVPSEPLYDELERFVQRAAGAEPGVEPDPSVRVRELLNGVETPETVRVLAFAQELIDRPELLATFWEALAGEAVTLVAYAPDADPAGIAEPLEAALTEYPQADVVLLAVPSGDEERIAESVAVLLTGGAALGAVPAANDVAGLRKLALGRDDGTPLVSIVIPVFNRVDLTRQCLEALHNATPEPTYEVIVVDNGSTDGTGWFLRSEQAAGRLRCLVNDANAASAAACNEGAAIARGESSSC